MVVTAAAMVEMTADSGDGESSGVDDGEQPQQSKTKEAAMEQRMVTTNDDCEQLQQSKTKEAAMELQIVATVTAMAGHIKTCSSYRTYDEMDGGTRGPHST